MNRVGYGRVDALMKLEKDNSTTNTGMQGKKEEVDGRPNEEQFSKSVDRKGRGKGVGTTTYEK